MRFKGFAAITSQPPANGNSWSTDPGNSPPAPSSVPSYMGVIVASQASQTGSTISGDTVPSWLSRPIPATHLTPATAAREQSWPPSADKHTAK